MLYTRLALVICGVLLPYVARVPGAVVHGWSWLDQYLSAGLSGFAFIQAFNILTWGTLYALTFVVRRPAAVALPTLCGFGVVGYAHAGGDLSADAQNAVALIFIPIFALPVILVTFVVSIVMFGRGRSDGVQRDRTVWTPTPSARAPSGVAFPCPGCGAVVNPGASHCKACDCELTYESTSPVEPRSHP